MPFINTNEQNKPCMSPEHNPPTHVVLNDGVHVWECPSCGKTTYLVITNPTCIFKGHI